MTNNVTYDGVTYDLDDLSSDGGRGYAASTASSTGGTAKPFYVTIMESALADAGKQLVTSSVTSITIGAGTHVFTMATSIPYKAGAFVLVADTAAPTTNFMIGQVTADATTTVSLLVGASEFFGSGTIASWNITSTGKIGPTGGAAPDADEVTKGIAELATQVETDAGTDDLRIVTPLKLLTTISQSEQVALTAQVFN